MHTFRSGETAANTSLGKLSQFNPNLKDVIYKTFVKKKIC